MRRGHSEFNARPGCLADEEQGGAEEGVELVAGGFVFGYGGFEGFLGGGAVVAEVHQGGEDVVGSGAGLLRSGGGVGEGVEFVFEFDDEALGEAFADAGDAGEGGVVLGANGADGALGGEAAEDGEGEFGADAGDGDEAFEELLLGALGESVEGEGVFANLGVDMEGYGGAFGGE